MLKTPLQDDLEDQNLFSRHADFFPTIIQSIRFIKHKLNCIKTNSQVKFWNSNLPPMLRQIRYIHYTSTAHLITTEFWITYKDMSPVG